MKSSLSSCHITFIGAGSIAEAIIRGLTGTEAAAASRICAVNRADRNRLAKLKERYGIAIASEPEDKEHMIREADVLVIAVKPKDVSACLTDLRHLLHDGQLLVSVVAGLSIAAIHSLLRRPFPVVRAMPNTSSTIGFGATGISFSPAVDHAGREIALEMFRSVGEVCTVGEELLDIVTGVSGSGPAYVYYLMEAMIRGGVEGGLTPETARQLTVQTVLGAAQMVKMTGEDPLILRKKVTSPNGTTQAALETLDAFRVQESLVKAVLRAAEKAREMGDEIGRAAGNDSESR